MSAEDHKRKAGERAAEYVEDGMVLGLGTGSTTYYAIQAIGRLVKWGYRLEGIPTSRNTEELARDLAIPLTSLEEVESIDLTIDGADEVDPSFRLIKGMGGALLREKIVAAASREEIIVVDGSKMVSRLGTRSPLPVEVVPFGHARTADRLEALGCRPALRGDPFITDGGNYIYDCRFDAIQDPEGLEREIDLIPGVVENGIFLGTATRLVVGSEEGVEVLERPR
ncbi:MAG: ribose-5-phosphate isomerase RpiA [Thermoplasmatota archaeon]